MLLHSVDTKSIDSTEEQLTSCMIHMLYHNLYDMVKIRFHSTDKPFEIWAGVRSKRFSFRSKPNGNWVELLDILSVYDC